MSSKAEYEAAQFRMKVHAEDSWNTGNEDDIRHYTLALRWLRVGAAMEAGTLSVSLGHDGRWDAAYMYGNGYNNAFSAPDPLTAAERAMGVAT